MTRLTQPEAVPQEGSPAGLRGLQEPKRESGADVVCQCCNGRGEVMSPFDPTDGRRCPECKGTGKRPPSAQQVASAPEERERPPAIPPASQTNPVQEWDIFEPQTTRIQEKDEGWSNALNGWVTYDPMWIGFTNNEKLRRPKPSPAQSVEASHMVKRITDYLSGGGLFNPEMAIHNRVRDQLIDCRADLYARDKELAETREEVARVKEREKTLESRYDGVQDEANELNAKLASLTSQHESVKVERDRAVNNFNTIVKKGALGWYDDQHKIIQSLQKQVESSVREAQEATTWNTKHKEELRNRMDEIYSLRALLEQAKAEREEFWKRSVSQADQIQSLQKKLEEAENKADDFWLEQLGRNKLADGYSLGETREETVGHIIALIKDKLDDTTAELTRLRTLSTWVSIADRRPTHLYSVLGFVTSGPLVHDDPFIDIVSWSSESKTWLQSVEGEDVAVNVSHWMDLPSRPTNLPAKETEDYITEHVYPPIPDRNFDWKAIRRQDKDEEQPVTGWGSTKEKAIRDLKMNLEAEDES